MRSPLVMANSLLRAAAQAEGALATLCGEIERLASGGQSDLYDALHDVLTRCSETKEALADAFDIGVAARAKGGEIESMANLKRKLNYQKRRRQEATDQPAQERANASAAASQTYGLYGRGWGTRQCQSDLSASSSALSTWTTKSLASPMNLWHE